MKREDVDEVRMRKECARVTRFLSAAPALLRSTARKDRLLLESGERGTITVAAAIVAALVRNGLARRQGDRLTLSGEGDAHLARSQASQAPFHAQHMELATRTISTERGREAVLADMAESPLAQLARRRGKTGRPFLDETEFRAGERLRADYTRGRIMPRLGANWSAAVADGRRGGSENGVADLTDAALAARQRVDRALASVDPELAGLLVDVCCFLKGMEQVEMERGWPVRSAKVVLKTALAALSRHYEPAPPARRRGIVHWGTPDYRPSLRGTGR